jgi:ribosomal protein S18 acetylase RimI-like enzyme
MIIRLATEADADAIWSILEPVIRVGETYTFPRDWSRAEAMAYWHASDHAVLVAEDIGAVVGTYYLRANQKGGGAHVANCGYVTDRHASGRGIARAMCLHSMDLAVAKGFTAMQFNFVVSTNDRAVRLWKGLGFDIVGTLPAAFQHPSQGLIDAYVMYRKL